MRTPVVRWGWVGVCGWVLGGCATTAEAESAPSAPMDRATTDPVTLAASYLAKGDPRRALEEVDRAIEERRAGGLSEDPDLWFAKGVALAALGSTDDAQGAWRHALEVDPEFAPALGGLGALALERGALDEAVALLGAALRSDPKFAEAHYNLGLALLGLGRIDDAGRAFEQGLALAPKDPDLLLELAKLRAMVGDQDTALAFSERATRAAPEDALVWVLHGHLLLRAGRTESSVRAFDEALRIAPGDVDAALGHAQAQLKLGRAEIAERELAELADLAPDLPVVWLEWGTAIARQGRPREALPKMERALALDGGLVAAHVRRIGALVETGNCADARAARRDLENVSSSEAARRAADQALAGCP